MHAQSRLTLCDPPWTVASQDPLWNFPGKYSGVGCHFLLQRIFSTQESNLHLELAGRFFTTESPGLPSTQEIHESS